MIDLDAMTGPQLDAHIAALEAEVAGRLSADERDALERRQPDRQHDAESGYSPPEFTCQRCGCKAIGWACGCERFNDSAWGER